MRDIDFGKLTFHNVVIRNQLELARDQVVTPILSAAAERGYCSQDQFALRLGLEEAVSNAYKHGNRCDPGKHIRVRWAVDDEVAVIYVADEGDGFDPDQVPDPTTQENREKPAGRGLMLMKVYMTELCYNDASNEVCLVKARKRRGDAATPACER